MSNLKVFICLGSWRERERERVYAWIYEGSNDARTTTYDIHDQQVDRLNCETEKPSEIGRESSTFCSFYLLYLTMYVYGNTSYKF